MNRYYTGVGSRNISKGEASDLRTIGKYLAYKGYALRSGKAKGADTAFQLGMEDYEDERAKEGNAWIGYAPEIYIPWKNFKNDFVKDLWDITFHPETPEGREALRLAEAIHPAWNRCSPAAKKFHARNIFQVLGRDTNTLSQFLLACSDEDENGDVKGGTRTAWMLAKQFNLPVCNIRGKGFPEVKAFLKGVIDG